MCIALGCREFPKLPPDAGGGDAARDAQTLDASLVADGALDAAAGPDGAFDAALTLDAAYADAGSPVPAGQLAFARTLGTSSTQISPHGIAVDDDGATYVAGEFQGNVFFGSSIDSPILVPGGLLDAFLVKMDATGQVEWAKKGSGTESESALAIAVTSDGGVVITGRFRGNTSFGEGGQRVTLESTTSSDDLFVAKYKSDATLVFARRAGGTSYDTAGAVASLAGGGAVVAGVFSGDAIFGAGEAGQQTRTASGDRDVFIARYDGDGALRWVERAGSYAATQCEATGVTAGADGVFVTGYYHGELTFAAGTSAEVVLPPYGQTDLFVAKYSLDGSFEWARRIGGSQVERSGGIVAVASDLFVSGGCESACFFQGGDPIEPQIARIGVNPFIARYGSDGSFAWVRAAKGSETAVRETSGLAAADGAVVMTGHFRESLGFDGSQALLESTTKADLDVFLVKYARDGSFLWATSAGGGSQDLSGGVALSKGQSLVTGSFDREALFGAGEPRATTLTSGSAITAAFVAAYAP
jgi:hypothetical protein